MRLVVDYREHDLISKLAVLQVKHNVENLHLGDIAFLTDDGSPSILVERKTFADLFSSIKDGRYEEQSHRLMHASGVPRHNIVYVLEGVVSQMVPKDRTLLYSCITSITMFKGFSVMRTASCNETADWICAMFSKLERDFAKGKTLVYSVAHSITTALSTDPDGFQGEPSNSGLSQYAEVVKKVKKENINAANIGVIMLCQIPGISNKSAVAILQKFGGSFPALLRAITENQTCLDDVKTTDANGKTRKISKVCAETIVRFFVEPPQPDTTPV